MAMLVNVFGGLETKRRSLHVRVLDYDLQFLQGGKFDCLCKHLQAFVGFRTVIIEVIPSPDVRVQLWHLRLRMPPRHIGDAPTRDFPREMMDRITLAVTSRLEPALGPAVVELKDDTGGKPVLDNSTSRRGNCFVGTFTFHPFKHSAMGSAQDEDKLQQGA